MKLSPYINIHTHQEINDPDILSIRNIYPDSFFENKGNNNAFFSVGIHPWYINNKTCDDILLLEKISSDKQIIAIGETGLDKLSETDFSVQQEIFIRQIEIAKKANKSLIVHCVKAWNETLKILDDEKIDVPVIFHGFRGKPQLAEDLIKKGYYLSFGRFFNEESLKNTPLDQLFLETDEANFPIQDLYRTISEIKNVDKEELKEKIWCNFLKINDH